MRVLICTYGRANNQITWNQLPEEIRDDTLLVVQHQEKGLYGKYPTLVLPDQIRTIGPTRQYLVDTLNDDRVVMLDDDLVFATRRKDEPQKFHPSTQREIIAMFTHIRTYLGFSDFYPHVGIAPREGANRNIERYAYNTRIMRLHGFFLPILKEFDIRFDRLPVMEDFDATLQLLGHGFENCILNNYCHNQGGSNTAGGCSTYRTPEIQQEAAEGLARLHSPHVSVVKKQTKTSWGGQERYDVRIQWKRKLQSARDADLLDARARTN